MIKKYGLFFLCISNSLYTIFEHDRAVSAGKKGDWQCAADLLQHTSSSCADVLYDKGVVTYHNKDFATAKECFLSAAGHPEATGELSECACFNAGNACFALQDLESARDQYKKTLEKNPENTFAHHNLKKVEELLKKKEEEKKQEQQKDKKSEEQKKEQQQKQDKQQQEQSQKQDEKKSSEKNGDGQQEQSSGKNGQQKENQEQKKNEQRKQEQQNNADEKNNKEQERDQEQKNSSGAEQKKDEQKKQAADSVGDQTKNQQKNSVSAQQAKKDPTSHDEWLAEILEKNEKRDAQGNKKMIKAMVQQQMKGAEGQNCW